MNLSCLMPLGLALCLFASLPGAQAKTQAHAKTQAPEVINDSWYTMQAGSTPFGIFHERIELRDGRFSYKYSLTRYEERGTGYAAYQENIGALAERDLTPVTFNLNKSGSGATETTNGTYAATKYGGVFRLEVQGARTDHLERNVSKGTILDVFFPIYLRQNWSKLKPGAKGWLKTFAEDPDQQTFRVRNVSYQVKGLVAEDGCLNVHIEMDNVRGDWCLTQEGVLVDLKVGSYHVRRAGSEQEARAFVSALAEKAKQQE